MKFSGQSPKHLPLPLSFLYLCSIAEEIKTLTRERLVVLT